MTRPDAAAALVAACLDRGLTIATGESVTAGRLAAEIADVPGCSAVLRGAVVAYHADLKADVLGVPAGALAHGVVSREVATAMAIGAAEVLRADIGIATTGVAGPDPHGGQPPGSVWIAVSSPGGVVSRHLELVGDRSQVRCRTVAACLALATDVVNGDLRE